MNVIIIVVVCHLSTVKLRQTSSNPSEHTETSEEFDDSLEHKDHISQLSVDKVPSSEAVDSHTPCEAHVLSELSDDLWLIIFNYLSISDRSKIERGDPDGFMDCVMWIKRCCCFLFHNTWLLSWSLLMLLYTLYLSFSVCKRWRVLSLLSWKRIRSLSFENMFKSIFRGGMHREYE